MITETIPNKKKNSKWLDDPQLSSIHLIMRKVTSKTESNFLKLQFSVTTGKKLAVKQ